MAAGIVVQDGKIRLRCRACGKQNAVSVDRLLQGPICGACRADLPWPDQPIELNDAEFARFVHQAPLPVLVDFWAPWCGPCRAMEPIVQQLARNQAGRALVAKLDTESNPRVATSLGIQAVPTVMVFDGGRPIQRQAGLVPEQALAAMLPRAA